MPCCKDLRRLGLGLQHDSPRDFVESQTCCSPSLYAVYRVTIATFFVVTAVISFVTYVRYALWFIFLTHWSYTIIAVNAVLQAVCVVRHYIDVHRKAVGVTSLQMSPVFKVIWVLQTIGFTTAPVVTSIYWVVIYSGIDVDLDNVNKHIINSVYVFVDVFVTGIPVRLVHFLYSLAFGTVYIVFTLVYWAAGGRNVHGDPFIYSILDYSNDPSTAVTWLLVVYVFLAAVHCATYALYRLRVLLVRRCRRDNSLVYIEPETADSEPVETKIDIPEEHQMIEEHQVVAEHDEVEKRQMVEEHEIV